MFLRRAHMAEVEKAPEKPERTQAERRRRINRLKKIIVLTVILAILLPVLLCIILFFKVGRLEQKVQELEAAREMRLAAQMSDSRRLSSGGGVAGYLAQADGSADPVMGTNAIDGVSPDGMLMGGTPMYSASEEAEIGESGVSGEEVPEPVSDDAGQAGDGADMHTDDGAADGDGQSEDSTDAQSEAEEDAELTGEQLYPDYRKVYLTFDDGPSSNTEEILDILDRYGVKATFFVVGKTDEHSQEMYRLILERGHTLGMHSYSHRYGEIYASTEAFTEDLEKIRSYLYDMTGMTSCFYRFPGGSSNALSSTDVQELIDVLNERGIIYFDWNVVNGDAGSVRLSAAQLADNVTNNMERYRTAIVLMHDASGKHSTVEALPVIIERILQMENTVILPITEDTARIQQVKADEESE